MPLLGGLSAAAFMRRHWQKKPLLVRAAMPRSRSRDRSRARCSRWRRATTSSRVSSSRRRRALVAAPRPVRAARAAAADDARLDPAGAGRRPARRRRAPRCSALPLLARCAPRRRDGLVRERRRRRRPARRFVRRVPAAGRGPAALAHRPLPRARVCATDVPLKMLADFVPQRRVAARARATCCTCRRGWGHDGVGGRRVHDRSIGFRAPAATSSPPTCSQRIADAAPTSARPTARRRRAATATPASPATTRPARIPRALQALRRRGGRAPARATRSRAAARSARC